MRGDVDEVAVHKFWYETDCLCLYSVFWWQDRRDETEQRRQ